MPKSRPWRDYERVAHHLLNAMAEEFGISYVEADEVVHGKLTGTDWAIEGKAILESEDLFLIVECRRYTTSKIKQEAVGGLAFRIHDSGASGGMIVSPLGLQEGAAKVAASQAIQSILLRPDSTTTAYVMTVLHDTWSRTYIGVGISAVLVEEASVEVKEVPPVTPS